MQYFGEQLHAYDNDVIQLFEALADFTQPIELQKTLGESIMSETSRERKDSLDSVATSLPNEDNIVVSR